MNLDVPLIEAAIERQPIVVAPQTQLVDVIALMNQRRAHINQHLDNKRDYCSSCSCALVMENTKLLGIFTERDIVRITAQNISLEGVKVAEFMVQPVITLEKSAFEDIFGILFLFRRYRIRHLPILSDRGEVIGVVSPESIRKILRPDNFLKMRRVADVMTSNAISASMTTSVLEIAQIMAEHRVSCVVITQELEVDYLPIVTKPVGIITERDIVQFQALKINLEEVSAQSVMSSPLFLLTPEDSLWTAHQEMQRLHVRRLVVSWNWGQGLGIVTLTSLLRIFDPIEMYGVIETLQQTIEQLEAEKAQLLQKLNTV